MFNKKRKEEREKLKEQKNILNNAKNAKNEDMGIYFGYKDKDKDAGKSYLVQLMDLYDATTDLDKKKEIVEEMMRISPPTAYSLKKEIEMMEEQQKKGR